jgi:predicted amidohydrolase
VQVLLVQYTSGPEPGANRDALPRVLAQAMASRPEPPHLVVLPEATQADFTDRDLDEVAEPLDGPFVTLLAELARQSGTTVVAGMFERRPDGLPWNTLVAVGPDGQLCGTYRKTHLYDAFGYRESERLSAGDPQASTMRVPGADGPTVGLMTCYDLRFPEQARALVDAGADLLVVPSAWLAGASKTDHWRTLLRARAVENTAYVVGVGKAGPRYCGSSLLVDPMGLPVVGPLPEHQDGAAAGDVSPARVAEVRQVNPSLANRRWVVSPATAR